MTQLWDYQFFGTGGNQFIVKGHDPYQVAGYSLSSPALSDGHVYYGANNGHVYCFGSEYPPPTTTTTVSPTTTTTMPPTLITLSIFEAEPGNKRVKLFWKTEAEINTEGFNLYRASVEDGEYLKINDAIIPALGSPGQGASYTFTDSEMRNRTTYWYKLEDIDTSGNSTLHGPVSATPRTIFLRKR